MNRNQRLKQSYPPSQGSSEAGILNENILVLLFKTIEWDVQTLCLISSVNRKLRAIAERVLWRELCLYRAPRMVATLADGTTHGRFCGGWYALTKLMFFCCGCESTQHFKVNQPSPGHFVKAARFSKTSGRSFLSKKCREDLLYVSDPCEHPSTTGDKEDDHLGIYRGVFKGFTRSTTRATLIERQAALEERVRCPYCGVRVWSMTTARLVPKSAARRLGSQDGGLEYFVCVNGHLHGTCWLVPLSSDDDETNGDNEGGEASGDGGNIDTQSGTTMISNRSLSTESTGG